MRVVPKGALEYVRAPALRSRRPRELIHLIVGSTALSRARVMIGAEIGRYFILRPEDPGPVGLRQVRRQFLPEPGIGAGQPGTRASSCPASGRAVTAWMPAPRPRSASPASARLYINYDGKFRNELTSHQGTVGFESEMVRAKLRPASSRRCRGITR